MNAQTVFVMFPAWVPTTFVRRAIKQISSSQRIFEPLKPLITILNDSIALFFATNSSVSS